MKVAVRVGLGIAALAVAAFVLMHVFGEFDWRQVGTAMRQLGPADYARVVGALAALLCAEAFLAAAFVPGLPVWRGGLTFLATSAVTSVVPGPSDYPLRYTMLRSWGYDAGTAATASAGPTLFNVAHKLVMPLVALVAIAAGQVRIEGVGRLVAIACAVLTLAVAAVGFAAGTAARTRAAAGLVARVVHRPVADRIVAARDRAVALARQVWRRALIGCALVIVASIVLFVWCLRAVGLTGGTAPVAALVAVWAMVRALSALPTTPGDVGLSELAYVSLLSQVTGRGWVNTITAGVLIYRLATFLAPVPLGLLAVGVWRLTLRHRRSVTGTLPADEAARQG